MAFKRGNAIVEGGSSVILLNQIAKVSTYIYMFSFFIPLFSFKLYLIFSCILKLVLEFVYQWIYQLFD